MTGWKHSELVHGKRAAGRPSRHHRDRWTQRQYGHGKSVPIVAIAGHLLSEVTLVYFLFPFLCACCACMWLTCMWRSEADEADEGIHSQSVCLS